MNTIKVRVNPEDHSDFVVLIHQKDGAWRRLGWDGRVWFESDEVADWPEYELEIPVPERTYRDGDMVELQEMDYRFFRALRITHLNWVVPGVSALHLTDEQIRKYDRHNYIGNIYEMDPTS